MESVSIWQHANLHIIIINSNSFPLPLSLSLYIHKYKHHYQYKYVYFTRHSAADQTQSVQGNQDFGTQVGKELAKLTKTDTERVLYLNVISESEHQTYNTEEKQGSQAIYQPRYIKMQNGSLHKTEKMHT